MDLIIIVPSPRSEHAMTQSSELIRYCCELFVKHGWSHWSATFRCVMACPTFRSCRASGIEQSSEGRLVGGGLSIPHIFYFENVSNVLHKSLRFLEPVSQSPPKV
jgi:hypothetical protein